MEDLHRCDDDLHLHVARRFVDFRRRSRQSGLRAEAQMPGKHGHRHAELLGVRDPRRDDFINRDEEKLQIRAQADNSEFLFFDLN